MIVQAESNWARKKENHNWAVDSGTLEVFDDKKAKATYNVKIVKKTFLYIVMTTS